MSAWQEHLQGMLLWKSIAEGLGRTYCWTLQEGIKKESLPTDQGMPDIYYRAKNQIDWKKSQLKKDCYYLYRVIDLSGWSHRANYYQDASYRQNTCPILCSFGVPYTTNSLSQNLDQQKMLKRLKWLVSSLHLTSPYDKNPTQRWKC